MDDSPYPPSPAAQHLVTYELDLGLNHVVRKSSEPLDDLANYLIPGLCLCARTRAGNCCLFGCARPCPCARGRLPAVVLSIESAA